CLRGIHKIPLQHIRYKCHCQPVADVSQDSDSDWNFREDECTSVQQRLKPRQYAVEVHQPVGNPITCAGQNVALESGAEFTNAKREDRAEKDAGYDMQGEGGDEEIVARNVESPATFKNCCVNPEQAERFDSQH